MFDDYNEPTHAEKQQALSALRDLGVAKAVYHFSGGNDEGGVDYTTFLDANGNEVQVPSSNAWEDRYYQNGGEHSNGWVVWEYSDEPGVRPTRRAATADEVKWAKIHQILEKPVYARYYTFAGEFYVDGELTWDVAEGTYRMEGQESHEVWESFSY